MSKTYTIAMASNVDTFAETPPPSGTPPELYFYFLFVSYETYPAGSPTFVVSQISGDKKSKRGATGTLPSEIKPQQRKLFEPVEKAPGNPKVSLILQAKPLPGSLVRVEVKVAGNTRSVEDFDFSPALNAGQVMLVLRRDQPPRLSLAINTTYVAKPEVPGNFKSPGPTEIKAVLRHIHTRLLEGPSAAWHGTHGSPEWPFTPGPQNSDEETWAKLVTEMLIVSPYAQPSAVYAFPGGENENPWFLKLLDDEDPGYPICYECQHLVTMAALTRGIFQRTKSGLKQFTAGFGSKGTVEALGGKFLPAASVGTVGDALNAGLHPGSSWVYNGRVGGIEVPNDGGAHIGFVLRVDPIGKRIQTFDTGGLNAPDRMKGVLLQKGTFDDPWVNATQHVEGPYGEKDVFKGVCLLPAAANLATAVDRMRRARPLGFARLVLVRRVAGKTGIGYAPRVAEKPDVLFAGPLLRMHYDSPTGQHNLSYAAYLWSLREHPGAADIQAIWLFYTSRRKLSKVVLEGSLDSPKKNARPLTLMAMLHEAQVKTPIHRPLTENEVLGVADHASQADGTVTVTRGYDQHNPAGMKPSVRPQEFNNLPWGKTSGTVALASTDLDDMPYFTSG